MGWRHIGKWQRPFRQQIGAQPFGVHRNLDAMGAMLGQQVTEAGIARALHDHLGTVVQAIRHDQAQRLLAAGNDDDLLRLDCKRLGRGQVVGQLHAQAPQAFRRRIFADCTSGMAQQLTGQRGPATPWESMGGRAPDLEIETHRHGWRGNMYARCVYGAYGICAYQRRRWGLQRQFGGLGCTAADRLDEKASAQFATDQSCVVQ